MIKTRYDIINYISDVYFNNDCSYLEIGVCDPDTCFNMVKAKRKTSVEPFKIRDNINIDYLMPSDQFFNSLKNGQTEFDKDFKWDIIFIDGLHLAEQTYKDIINSLRHCSGFIFLHDCAPKSYLTAHSDYEYFLASPHEWNGTTWKAFYKYRTETDRKTYTIDTDWGIGVIEINKNGNPIAFDNKWLEYGEFRKNMTHDLGLISVEDFVAMHQNKPETHTSSMFKIPQLKIASYR